MPGKQVLADSRSIHPVNTPLRLVETRPAVPRFPARYSILYFAIYMSSVGESHVISSLFHSSIFLIYFLESFLFHILMLWLCRCPRAPCNATVIPAVSPSHRLHLFADLPHAPRDLFVLCVLCVAILLPPTGFLCGHVFVP